MFKGIISDTKSWKNSIDAIAVLIDEGTLQINEDGLKLRAMDPSQIAMIDFELPSSGFEQYEVDKPTQIGIDFSELNKITRRIKAEDRLELSLDTGLNMIFKGKTTRKFNLPIIDSTTAPAKEPSISFCAEVKISAEVIREALKDAELVSNHVAMYMNDGFSIKAEGDTGSVNINFSEENILSMDVSKKANAVFSLDYLNYLLKAANSSSIIVLKMLTDAPLRLEYVIGDGKVVYYLAPRIESV